MDCKGILIPILRTWVQKSTLLLQNRGHAEVLKKTPSSAKYVTKVRPPSVQGEVGIYVTGRGVGINVTQGGVGINVTQGGVGIYSSQGGVGIYGT